MDRQGSEAGFRKITKSLPPVLTAHLLSCHCLSYNLEKILSDFSWSFPASEPCPFFFRHQPAVNSLPVSHTPAG